MNQGAAHTAFLGHLTIALQKALPDARVFRMTSGVAREPHFRRLGIPGHPDLFVLVPGGRIIYVEAKTGAGRLSPLQASWRAMCLRLGVPHILATLPAGQDSKSTAEAVASTVLSASRSHHATEVP